MSDEVKLSLTEWYLLLSELKRMWEVYGAAAIREALKHLEQTEGRGL